MTVRTDRGVRMRDASGGVEATAIEALAWGLLDAGVTLATGYPGFHAHELVDLCGGTFSVNERTAFGLAWGASAAGARTAVALKNVGLNDAADPFVNAMRLRTSGGTAVVVFDDVEVEGSQCRLDSRPYFDLAPGLWLEPTDAGHAYRCARLAPALSEEFGMPVVVRVTNPLLRTRGTVARGVPDGGRAGFRRDPVGLVAHPVNAREQERTSAGRLSRVADYVESLYAWPGPASGPVCLLAGACEAPGGAGLAGCRVWTYPLPERGLRAWLAPASTVDVYELGGPVVANAVGRATAGGRVRSRDTLSAADHSGQYRVSSAFEPLFAALRSFPDRIVCGDLGSYTMDPARTIDVCLCYGASVAVAGGGALAAPGRRVFCVTGDAAFLHSGLGCLGEVAARGVKVVVVLLDNGRAASTGGQLLPAPVVLPPGVARADIRHAGATSEDYRRVLAGLAGSGGTSVLRVTC